MNEERIHHAPKGLKVFPEEGRKAQPSIRGARSGLRFLSLSYSLSPAEGGVDLQPPVTMSPRLEEEFPPLFLQVGQYDTSETGVQWGHYYHTCIESLARKRI